MPTRGLARGERDVPHTPRRTSSWSSFFGTRRKQQRHEVLGATSDPPRAPATEPHQEGISNGAGEQADQTIASTGGGQYWGSVIAGDRDQTGDNVEYLHGLDQAGVECESLGPAREGTSWGWMDLKSWDRPDQWAPDGWIQTIPNGPLIAHQRSQSLDCQPSPRGSPSSTPPPTSSSFRTTPTPRRKSFSFAMDRIDSISDSNHSTPTPNTPTRISPSAETSRPSTPITPLSARTRSPTPTRTTSGYSRLRSASIASSLSFASTTPSVPHSSNSHSNPSSTNSSPTKLQSRSLSLRINTTLDEQGRRVLSSVRRRSVAQDGSAPPLPVHKLKKQFGIGSDDEFDGSKGSHHDDVESENEGEREETLLSEDSSSQCSPTPSSPYPPSPYSPTFSSETEGESSTSASSFSRTSSLSRTISSTSASSISLSHQQLGPRRTPSFSLSRKGTPPKVLRRKSLAEGSLGGLGGFMAMESGPWEGVAADSSIRRSASQTEYGSRSGPSGYGTLGTGGDYFSLGIRVREKEVESERAKEKAREREGEKVRWEPDDGADYGHSLTRTRTLLRVINPDLVLETEPRTIIAPVPISLPSSSSPPSVVITSRPSKLIVPSKDVFVGWAL